MKAKRWRCFFCDEVFTSRREAYLHFGDDNSCAPDVPACVDPLRSDEKARMKELREAIDHGLQMQIRAEKVDDLESQISQFRDDLEREFGQGCTTVWQAADRYKNALFRISELEKDAVTAVEAP